MIKPRQTSVVILITLAELAWLAAFGLLFAYRGKVGQLGVLQRSYDTTSNRLAQVVAGATNVARLVDDLERSRTEQANLQSRLDSFNGLLLGKSPEEASRLLKAGADADARINVAEGNAKKFSEELRKKDETLAEITLQLQATNSALADLQRKLDALPPNVAELVNELRKVTNRLFQANTQLVATGAEIAGLSNKIGRLESGEVAIRRELIGLPTNELRRVIFIVDTSSSMRNSPAWDEARNLMRTWVEYLSVEESVLVNFNDKAVAFPATGYQRVRERGSGVIPQRKAELLAAFDNARPGIYSDLLEGLKLAYNRPKPDLIVLFTDGHPHVATRTDTKYGSSILQEVSRHPEIPILTVAVGSYEVEGAGGPKERRNAAIAFLKQLAKQTGGNFIGR